MKSKKVFSVILSLSLMFSGMSFCFGEKNVPSIEKFTYGPTEEENLMLENALTRVKDYCNEGKRQKVSGFMTSCKPGKPGDLLYAQWLCKEKTICEITNYDKDSKSGIFKVGEKKFGIIEDALLMGEKLDNMASIFNATVVYSKYSSNNESFWSVVLQAGIIGGLAWLGKLIYENYKLITGKNNKNSQAQQSKYYYDANSGIYYIVDQQGTFQPVYQGSTPVMMPQEKKEPEKEEKLSNPEVNEKKEDAPKTEEKSTKVEQDKILNDIVEDVLVN